MKKDNIFNDRRVIFVLALVLAAVSWIIIAGFINPGDQVPIKNITIDYERNAQVYLDRNLQVVGEPVETYASVRVQGDGSVIGRLNQTSVTVYADYSGVHGPGTYEVPLYYERVTAGSWSIIAVTAQGSGYDLDNPKDTATITFEEVSRKTVKITPKADMVSADTGYVRGTLRAEPEEVEISGPKTFVDQISQVVAEVTEEEVLIETTRYTVDTFALLDENGLVLNAEGIGLNYSVPSVVVNVPVLETQEVGLDVGLLNLPQGFDEEWLRGLLVLSHDKLEVAAAPGAFEHLDDPYIVYELDITSLGAGWESDPINITLPDGFFNRDDLRQVTVSFNSTDLVERTIEVPSANIRVANQPANATVTPVGDSIAVRVIGQADQVNALLPENISVQLDASSVSLSQGAQQEVPARILIPKYNRIFAVGDAYTMICDVAAG